MTTPTAREQQVLDLIARGLTDKDIARTLGISPNTVRNHVAHLLRKSDCANRTQLAVVHLAGAA